MTATLGGTVCAVLLLTAACSSSNGLTVPQVNLGSWAYARTSRAAREQVTTRIAAAVAALRADHLSISAEAVTDSCSRWVQVQGNGATTEWGVQCSLEEDVFGGFNTAPAAQSTAIRRALERYGWGDWQGSWAELVNNVQCGNYARGNESQLRGDSGSVNVPLAATAGPGNEIQADVNVGPASGPAAHGNINYILGCAVCGPDAIPGTTAGFLDGIPPNYYIQHTCPRGSAIENALAGQAGMWHVEFFDSGYVYSSTQSSFPPTPSPS